ncbi:MAG: hypothetical protein COW01_06095 [Bdellovibrionales bacterium CG12_big_fil_rev_8_21_14_0_65_38_15]|nr:MAG: hypothetical protein COW79_03990 [Bdellovibrionales bacterium CG22_combo_CG10-13_8_21_14_all_38_13]PIQ56002.1 MAG: hypothetical protein COW01_06095 [Bdellovibrionales bacterium CG12_big_fil_rev_8_21_14_0_65_38_15]PIR30607.1 MAG: hypothetical protein COV38_04635 [Bdellovibrionales bacterium CG11_big_fil_rev_8_21_14_0_20_38_13]
MSEKYRVKLENNRIVGPFSPSQIAELFERGHVSDASPCQVFPAGDWFEIEKFSEIKEAILSKISGKSENTQTAAEATVVNMMLPKKKTNKQLQEKLSTTDTEETKSESSIDNQLNEFKFDKEQGHEVDYEELEKKYQEKKKIELAKINEAQVQAKVKSSENTIEEEVETEDPSLDKTRVINRPKKNSQADVDKTRVIQRHDIAKPNEDKLIQKIEEQAKKIANEPIEEEPLNTSEATEFINIRDMVPALSQNAELAEKEIVTLAKQKRNDDKSNLSFEEPDELDESDDDEVEEKKRGMKPIVLIAFLVVFWMLFFEDDKKPVQEINPQRVSIVFPSQGEYLDEVKANQALAQGLEQSALQSYLNLVAAAKAYRVSLFYKFQDNPAMGQLIQTYSQLFPNAKSKLEASTTLFNLIRVSQDKVLTDANVAIGTANFYLNSNKYLTAVNTIENYLRVSKKPTVTMLSIYLEALVKAGRLSDSKDVFNKLKDLNKLPIEAYINIADYLDFDEKKTEATKFIDKGLVIYPNSVELLLRKADLLLSTGDIKSYEMVLRKVEELKAEQSPIFYADLLEHMGNAAVLNAKSSLAADFYRKSLQIRESSELRARLATLSIGGDKASQALIKESKIHELIKKSKFAIKEFDWESAFVYAIEASDLNPLYIESNLLLVDIQIKRGFFSAALSTLQRLKKEYPSDKNVNNKLIETYILAYRFNDAITSINEFAQVDGAVNTPEYASMLGRYYFTNGNDLTSIKWLSEAVNRDPLADEDLYLMARIYIKNGKYNDGKLMLSKALTLDPVNLKYQVLYAQTLYDQDGADTAIGYLRDILQSNKDSPQILGEIAKYYYKSGQIKEFNIYKEKIESQETKDESFYRFMIYASELNQQADKVLLYARELIKINPGELSTHIKIGEYLAKQGRYDQSIEAFQLVKDRLDSYPKINYMIAKSYLEMGKLDKALEFAELEIKKNPKIPEGYYITGEVLAKKEQWPQAIKNLEKAVTIDFSYVEALLSLGILKRKQNSYEQSRELLLRALKQEPNNPIIHKELGYVYRAVGQGVLAAESFNTYLTLMPSATDRSEIEALIRATQ